MLLSGDAVPSNTSPVSTPQADPVRVPPTVKGLSLDMVTAHERVRELSSRYHLDVDPDAYVKDLSVGQQQRV